MARRQPELFVAAQIQSVDFSVDNRPGLVPADVAASQNSLAGRPLAGEDPLLTVLVLEIADVCVGVFLFDNRWITACRTVMIANGQQWLGHPFFLQAIYAAFRCEGGKTVGSGVVTKVTG